MSIARRRRRKLFKRLGMVEARIEIRRMVRERLGPGISLAHLFELRRRALG